MKPLIACLLFLAIVSSSSAELAPSAYDKMQKTATEVLRVLVLRVDVQPTSDAVVKEVTMLAETLKVGRTSTKLKPGDMITIKYRVTDRVPGWTGPGEVPVLKDNAETVAFLAPLSDTQEYAPAAGAMSFEQF
jgi:hypothetical protein